ncbi:MAG: helix-turn-helix transcriptional regulator [Acidobacteriota bacterium]|nr:helix-turn-helix transcriptional regulator [Acidobacteriota bacterium]
MGTRHPRPQPDRLAEKLRQLRSQLGYTLEEMAQALSQIKKSPPNKSHIHRFEAGIREPSLFVLLEYSRVTGVPLEVLVDDELDLPKKLHPRLKK